MDIDAVFKKFKDFIPVNIIKSISKTGGPPAIKNGKIEDAIAFYYLKVHHIATRIGVAGNVGFDEVTKEVQEELKNICLDDVSASVAFKYDWYVDQSGGL